MALILINLCLINLRRLARQNQDFLICDLNMNAVQNNDKKIIIAACRGTKVAYIVQTLFIYFEILFHFLTIMHRRENKLNELEKSQDTKFRKVKIKINCSRKNISFVMTHSIILILLIFFAHFFFIRKFFAHFWHFLWSKKSWHTYHVKKAASILYSTKHNFHLCVHHFNSWIW